VETNLESASIKIGSVDLDYQTDKDTKDNDQISNLEVNSLFIGKESKGNIDYKKIGSIKETIQPNQDSSKSPYRWSLLNLNPGELEKERLIAEQKKLIIEKITFYFRLTNLHIKKHKKCEFQIEILFSNSENEDLFFTIGSTNIYKANDKMEINFNEEFEINYLFERTQFVRFMIYSNDGKTSEITINLANVIFRKLTPGIIPVDLLLGTNINYTENIYDENLPQFEINYKRTTKFLDKDLTALYCDFQYHFAYINAKRLRYHLVLEDFNNEKVVMHKSNELFGKSPLSFGIANFESKILFESVNVKHYILEIYEGDSLYGSAILERKDMDLVLSSNEPIAFNIEKSEIKDNKSKSRQNWIGKNLKLKINLSPMGLKNDPNKLISPMLSPRDSHNSNKLIPNTTRNEEKRPTSKFVPKKNLNVKKTKNNTNKSLGNIPTIKKPEEKKKSSKDIKIDVDSYHRNEEKKLSIADFDLNRSQGSIRKNKSSTNKSLQEIMEGINGQIFLSIKQVKRMKFLDYILGGMEINFATAIDYTSSNLDPKKPDSLHTLNLLNNKYVKAIRSCGNILKNYDTDQLFPVFGFGGVPNHGKEVSHCFNLNGKRDPNIAGLDEVIDCYKTSLKEVQFVGPTHFQFILKNMIENVEKKTKKSHVLTYYVCLILTDGKIEHMDETKHILIEASKLPISVIIVGIGNGDFGKMNILGKYTY